LESDSDSDTKPSQVKPKATKNSAPLVPKKAQLPKAKQERLEADSSRKAPIALVAPTKPAVSKAKLPKAEDESSTASSSNNVAVAVDTASDLNVLPEFARAAWSTSFLPTLYSRLACSNDPFVIDLDLVTAIQEIVDIVYPNTTYKVRLNDKMYSMVGQALFEDPSSHLYVFRQGIA
jgi:hypothetical protein